MDATKIRLSPQEMELLANSEWILTKNGILEKGKWMLENMGTRFQNESGSYLNLPQKLFRSNPKVSKGENYQGLPYLVLDYPRNFRKPDVFAVRCMLWWGNFFSITLHLAGAYKAEFIPSLEKAYDQLAEAGFYVSRGEEEWEHHFEPSNYTMIRMRNQEFFANQLSSGRFVKIAKPVSLKQWDIVQDELQDGFEMLMRLL